MRLIEDSLRDVAHNVAFDDPDTAELILDAAEEIERLRRELAIAMEDALWFLKWFPPRQGKG